MFYDRKETSGKYCFVFTFLYMLENVEVIHHYHHT